MQEEETTEIKRQQQEAMWELAETKNNFFIPGLFRVIGVTLHCYLSVAIVFVVAIYNATALYIRDLIEWAMSEQDSKKKQQRGESSFKDPNSPQAKALSGWMAFYTQWLYNPISDCWNRPIIGAAAKQIDVVAREWKDDHGVRVLKVIPNGPTRKCSNLGSYNYLGFGGPNEFTTPDVLSSIKRSLVMTPSTACEVGISREQRELEIATAEYLGKEDAIIVPMGFATNSMVLPALVGKGSLVLSDDLNHASIITGLRLSGATLRRCGHNDPAMLEKCLAKAVTETPKWKRILVVIEGLYSMEGELAALPEVVRLCKRYGAFVYVDEAHSVGALGTNGRGICEYYGIDPRDVDILMGTYTKSFGSIGGYVASSRRVASMLRRRALASVYGTAMAPGCAQQAISALREMTTARGIERSKRLRDNSILMRKRLADAGCDILGPHDSPVIPIMVVHPAKLSLFSRECLRRGVALVVVGYPATPLLGLRARLCVSAAFETREVEEAAATLLDVARMLSIDFYSARPQEQLVLQKGCSVATEQENNDTPTTTTTTNNNNNNNNNNTQIDFQSEPFVAETDAEFADVRVYDATNLPKVMLGAFDYFGAANNEKAMQSALQTASEYGCGACGPRGFYGTTDKHLELEERLTRWVGTEASIVYSYGALAQTSALPPFTNQPEDVVLYDEAICLNLRFGVNLCKARRVIPFPHNNMKALAQIMKSIADDEKAASTHWWTPKGRRNNNINSSKGRHFIVTEGVFASSGDIAPLDQLLALKRKFGYMMLLDETHSLGAIGRTGRGAREYWAEKMGDESLMTDVTAVDLIVGSLEMSLGSIGGFCCGSRKLIQHQVLGGIGYVFSAAGPPYLCSAGVSTIDLVDNEGERRAETLLNNCAKLRELCRTVLGDIFDLSGNNDASPLMFLSLRPSSLNAAQEERVLQAVSDACWKDQVGVCVAQFLEWDEGRPKRPCLRLCASAKHTQEDYIMAVQAISVHTREMLRAKL